MQTHVDFVSAFTSEPPIDFVTALSAEQGCDVCHELHASVDELTCATCEAAICPDCARLRADATWACAVCYVRHPSRIFKPATDRGRRAQLRMHAQLARVQVVAQGRDASLRMRAWALAFTAWALATARPLLARAQEQLRALRALLALHGPRMVQRGRALRVTVRADFERWLERARQSGYREATRLWYEQASQRTRLFATRAWVALRSLPVRHHATSMMLAGAILYTVARADHRDV